MLKNVFQTMCVDIKRRSKKSKLSKLKNCNNHPDNSFNSFALRKLKNQNQAKFCQNVVCKKYQIFEAHSNFKWDINLSKAFASLEKREKSFEIRFSFGVCLVEPHDFYDLFCHGCKRKISKRKRTLVAIEPGTADEMCSGMTTVIWNILNYLSIFMEIFV